MLKCQFPKVAFLIIVFWLKQFKTPKNGIYYPTRQRKTELTPVDFMLFGLKSDLNDELIIRIVPN